MRNEVRPPLCLAWGETRRVPGGWDWICRDLHGLVASMGRSTTDGIILIEQQYDKLRGSLSQPFNVDT